MSIAAGLVGLPNVGKSTLFNALTHSCVPAENYPFCTIEPHIAVTIVPDERVQTLQALYKSAKIVPASVQFVDIAGLVKGAAAGEGLGNQFLSHIREVDLIIHVLRCFEDPLITYSRDEIDPLIDFEIIVTELMLKDIDSVQKRLDKVGHLLKQAKNNPPQLKELQAEKGLLEGYLAALNANNYQEVQRLVSQVPVATIPLLSAKRFLIVANVAEREIADDAYQQNTYYQKLIKHFGHERVIPLSARLEQELSQLSPVEAEEMASLMGVTRRGTDLLIKQAYKHLGLITFFTCGPQETHAWPIQAGLTIRQAAGKIHSDLERGFICAEVWNYADLVQYGSEAKLRELGKIRTEGQDYRVQDGDIVHVKFNV